MSEQEEFEFRLRFEKEQAAPKAAATPGYLDTVKANVLSSGQAFNEALMQGVRKSGQIGATLIRPFESGAANADRRAAIGGFMADKFDPNSGAANLGGTALEVAGTAGAGPLLGMGAKALGIGAPMVNALASSGFTTGAPAAANALGRAGDMGMRMLGGGATGGATMGLIDPQNAGTAAAIGAALPPALRAGGALAGGAGRAIGKAVAGGPVAPEVQALAKRANELGIDLPADRIADSKPLNAFAAGLNYVPFAGRQAVESRMHDQMNTALSRTFGQNSSNVTMALRKAQGELGAKFETTLKNNRVAVDDPMLTAIGDVEKKASRELGSDGMKAITGQIEEILDKGALGQIDGQAAYNIKRDLDRIGSRSTPEAYHARELKKVLMSALDRSLGPKEAAAFAKTRQQYGNMLDLENLAQNGAEGGISVGRLANMKNIGNPEMQELADIAAQFLKTRENPHGAAQRATAGLAAASIGFGVGGPAGALLGVGGTAAVGRASNALLDSSAMKNAMLRKPMDPGALEQLNLLAGPGLYRAAPRFGRP